MQHIQTIYVLISVLPLAVTLQTAPLSQQQTAGTGQDQVAEEPVAASFSVVLSLVSVSTTLLQRAVVVDMVP